MRIAKFIANSGLCSRRDAEKLIINGRVQVDGEVILTPALNVDFDNIVKVDNKLLKSIPDARLWLYYKPMGLITTHNDPQNRPTIFQQFKNLPRVISVGRLDINSEGLLLLTNNGELARYFERPQNSIERKYKVRAHGQGVIPDIENKKIIINNITYNPKLIKLTKKGSSNSWYEVVLAEGKNREIRKIFEHFNLKVNRLIRTNYGVYDLGNMRVGEYKEVEINENYCWKI
jgi:23S rRNA pseudouridine2605 synthase